MNDQLNTGDKSQRQLVFSILFLFVFANWLMLCLSEKMGPPDFYSIYNISEKIFSGNFNIEIIPPLFPIMLYPVGKLLSLFIPHNDAFLIAGRLISLVAGLITTWLTFKILEKLSNFHSATIGTIFMALSPWFLKLLPFPITDMVYLCFAAAVFYCFLTGTKAIWPVIFAVGAVLTRYEGILLFLAGAVYYLKWEKKYIRKLAVFAGLGIAVLVFFAFFSSRIFALLKDIVIPKKSYLMIFLHPIDFSNVLAGNILFFIPGGPSIIKTLLFAVCCALAVYGTIHLLKLNKHATLAILSYEILFLILKAYVDVKDPEREFRRIASGLWIFYILAFAGLVFFLKQIQSNKLRYHISIACGLLILMAVPVLNHSTLFPHVFMVLPPIILVAVSLWKSEAPKRVRTISTAVLCVFIFFVYSPSYTGSRDYTVSYARKGSFAAAKWINETNLKPNTVILSFTNNTIMNYYLDKEKLVKSGIIITEIRVPGRYSKENQQYIDMFIELAKEKGATYTIFDHYVVNQPEFLAVNDLHDLLWDFQDDRKYFEWKKILHYNKEKDVARVLRFKKTQFDNAFGDQNPFREKGSGLPKAFGMNNSLPNLNARGCNPLRDNSCNSWVKFISESEGI